MGWRWLEELTRADVAFEATGATPAEVLSASWRALVEVMLPGLGQCDGLPLRGRTLTGRSWEHLLLDLLEWVVYVKDAEGLILAPGEVVFRPPGEPGGVAAEVVALCVPLTGPDGAAREQGTDVKAVTMHRFSMEPTPEGWRATVILDV